MIVIDASVMVDLLIGRPSATAFYDELLSREPWHAPHLIDLEVTQALRRFVRTNMIAVERGEAAIAHFVQVRLVRHGHLPLLNRVWALRHILTAYDAAYVTLAAALNAPLVTRDGRLAASAGHAARIEVV